MGKKKQLFIVWGVDMFKELIGNQRLRQKINTLELDKEILEDEYDRLITKYNKLIKEMKQRDNRILELEEELKSKKKGRKK